ncbi:aa3 type cytochrome c oxidase subunit IV [Sphingobium faniae]|nr:aa3 type cytochrome c oxidase subunit IV [Sphingobium faniae]
MAQQDNIQHANETYAGFVGMVKWGTIVSVIATVVVVLLISG